MTDEYRVCCNVLHVKTATWIIAIVHFILAAIMLLSSVLYFLGLTDRAPQHHGHALGSLSTGGASHFAKYGFGGVLVAAVLWMVFVCLLIYGLHKNRAIFVLCHWIFCVVLFVLDCVQIVLIIIDGHSLENVLWFIIVALGIASLLYVEYKCYQFIRNAYRVG